MKISFRMLCILILTIFISIVSTGCTGREDVSSNSHSKGRILIGCKDFTEQKILCKMTAIYLREKGYDVEEIVFIGSSAVRSALEQGYIDMYWEYTGTGLTLFNRQPKETDPEKAYKKVKKIDAPKGIVWLGKTDFNSSYTILMRKSDAKEKGVKTLSDLSNYINKHSENLIFGCNAEFYQREDGLKGLEQKYGFHFAEKNVVKMEPGLTYTSLKEKIVDVAMGFATDGRIEGFDLVALEDDKNFFPVYNAAPVVRKQTLANHPQIKEYLEDISSKLDEKSITLLNYMVDVEQRNLTVVVREWLDKNVLKTE